MTHYSRALVMSEPLPLMWFLRECWLQGWLDPRPAAAPCFVSAPCVVGRRHLHPPPPVGTKWPKASGRSPTRVPPAGRGCLCRPSAVPLLPGVQVGGTHTPGRGSQEGRQHTLRQVGRWPLAPVGPARAAGALELELDLRSGKSGTWARTGDGVLFVHMLSVCTRRSGNDAPRVGCASLGGAGVSSLVL